VVKVFVNESIKTVVVDVTVSVVPVVVVELAVVVAVSVVVVVVTLPAAGDVTMQEHACEIKDGSRFTVWESEKTLGGRGTFCGSCFKVGRRVSFVLEGEEVCLGANC
jgi:hypothetical protein